MGKELAFTTSAFISTDNLETFYAKKSDVICFWFPLRCDIYIYKKLGPLRGPTISSVSRVGVLGVMGIRNFSKSFPPWRPD